MFEGIDGEVRSETDKHSLSHGSGAKPADLVDGELVLSTPSGVGLEILSNLSRLKASDLAFIETFVPDDMVRIMSMNYEHLHAAGEMKIVSNQGFVDQVTTISDTEKHALNSPEGNLKFKASGKNALTLGKDDNTDYYLDGKWLLTDFKGKLGNVISGWIQCPESFIALEKDSYYSNCESGRARYHFNQDGSIVFQSLGDIILEKVVCIPVPKLNKTRLDEIYEISKRELQCYAEWVSEDKPSVSSYQQNVYKIRDYARYLTNYLTLSEFRAQEAAGRIVIPTDQQMTTVMPSVGASEDSHNINEGAYHQIWDNYLVYSTARFTIMRNGDVVITDNTGNSISMNIDGVKICSATNLELHAAGWINMYAGQDINILARQNVEISAVMRGVLIKANRWLEAFCWKGPAVFQSDFVKIPEFPTDEERKAYLRGYAGEGADTDGDYQRRCDNAKNAAVTVRSSKTGDIQVVAGEDSGNIILKAASSIYTSAVSFLNKLTQIFGISKWFHVSQDAFLSNSATVEFPTAVIRANDINLTRDPVRPSHDSPYSPYSLVPTDIHFEYNTDPLTQISDTLDAIFSKSISYATFSYRKDATANYVTFVENLTQQTLRIWDDLDSDAMPPNIHDSNLKWESEDLFTNKWLGDETIGYPWPKGSGGGFKMLKYDPFYTSYTTPEPDNASDLMGKFWEDTSFKWRYYVGVGEKKD